MRKSQQQGKMALSITENGFRPTEPGISDKPHNSVKMMVKMAMLCKKA